MGRSIEISPPPQSVAIADLERLRVALRAAGFTEAAVADVEKVVPRQLDQVRAPAVRRVLDARADSAAPLLALLLYDAPVAAERLHDAIGSGAVQTIVDSGLARRDGERILATGRLVPFLGTYIAGDRPDAGPEAVMPPGPTTQEIGASLPVEFTGRVLDVATGPGSLAIVAATRGAHVVGTDVSERALAFAAFNAALNGVEVDWRAGSLLAPVRGETFDLVVAQPPFIPRPEALEGVTFAHGGREGDELAFELLRDVKSVLQPDGIALVRFDAPRRSKSLVELVREAVGDEGADVCVVTWPGATADHEAVMFATLADWTLGEEYSETVRLYGDHLAALGIEHFVSAIAVVRPSDGTVWSAGLPLAGAPGSGGAIASYVYALDAAGSSDNELARTRLAPNPGISVVTTRALGATEEISSFEVQRGVIAASRPADPNTLAVLDAFVGGRTPTFVATALAEVTGVDEVVARTTVLGVTREALAAGYLVVA